MALNQIIGTIDKHTFTYFWVIDDFIESQASNGTQVLVSPLYISNLKKTEFSWQMSLDGTDPQNFDLIVRYFGKNKIQAIITCCTVDYLNVRHSQLTSEGEYTYKECCVLKSFLPKIKLLHPNRIPFDKGSLRIGCYITVGNYTNTIGFNIHPFQIHSQKFDEMLQDQEHHDVMLTVGDSTFYVHKFILSRCSSYFKSRFAASPIQPAVKVVDLPNVPAVAIRELLRFIYTCKINETSMRNLQNIFIAAKNYRIGNLITVCETLLISKITNDTVCDLILFAQEENAAFLKENIIKYIAKNIDEVLVDDLEQSLVGHYEITFEIMTALNKQLSNSD